MRTPLQVSVLALGMFLGWVSWERATTIAAEPKAAAPSAAAPSDDEKIDFEKARQLLQRERSGGKLTPEEQTYLDRAKAARAKGAGRPAGMNPRAVEGARQGKPAYGFKPLTEMTAEDRYQGEDGGLYGGGKNDPPASLKQAAEQAAQRILPLNAAGDPAADGQIALISISMSNATQEFSKFKEVADADAAKSPKLTIIDCAQGGQAMAEWVNPQARPWQEAARRLESAGVSPKQVQAAWIKIANKGPRGDLKDHGKQLEADTQAVIRNARAKFPNLRIVYLSSRIYGGWSTGSLNPEPYAYEGGFVVRWLIDDQVKPGEKPDSTQAPVLLWGPYLWADGETPRKSDALTWPRSDLREDGTHPSESGRLKAAQLLLDFFKNDPSSKGWFVKP